MSCRSKLGCLVAMLGVCACGGVSRVDHPGLGNEAAGSASGGQASAGRSGDEQAGSASGGRNAAGASAGGASGASNCAQFKDDSRQSASVEIVNDTLAPIYIGPRAQTCGAKPLYEVRDASNTLLAGPDPCGYPSCQSWLAGEPVGGCTAICLPSEVTQLDAGERIAIPWSGLFRLEMQLPRACNGAHQLGEGPEPCNIEKRVEPGAYEFYAEAGSGYECYDDVSDCGECVPGVAGGCVVHNAMVIGAVSSAQSLVQLDPGYGISGSAGSANMSGKPLPIELVFRRPL